MKFSPTLDGDTIEPRLDIPTKSPDRRHVQIVKPAAGSHRRAGQIYLQSVEV